MPNQTFDITRLSDDAPFVDLIATGTIALLVIVTARVLYRRLPRGMPEGMFAAALSGAACLTVVARAGDLDAAATTLVSVLGVLSAAWLLAARAPVGGDARERETRRIVFSQTALLCGILAALTLLLADPIGLGERLRMYAAPASIWALLASAAALAAMIAQGLAHWRFRKRVSQSDPAKLTEPIGCPAWLFTPVVVAAVVAGACAVLAPQSALGPLTLSLAALACFNVFHRIGGGAVGDVAMVLLVAAVVTAATGWLPAPPATESRLGLVENALIGMAIGGIYALWLAKFWQQQLLDGQPWTSTGRLIPAARRCGAAAAVGCGVLAGVVTWHQIGGGGTVRAVIGAMLTLLLSLALIREANRHGNRTRGFCAWPASAAAAILLGVTVGRVTNVTELWMPFLAAGGLFVTFSRRGRAEFDDALLADRCWLGGILPVIILYGALTCGSRTPQSWVWTASASLPAAACFIRGRTGV